MCANLITCKKLYNLLMVSTMRMSKSVTCCSYEKSNMYCLFSTLTLINMKNGAFLPEWAQYWEENMQIRSVSTHWMIYKTWRYFYYIERWKGRCKWLNAYWLLSFSPGNTGTCVFFLSATCYHEKFSYVTCLRSCHLPFISTFCLCFSGIVHFIWLHQISFCDV